MNVRILVLGILMCRPAHGYEIQQYLQLHELERFSGILPGSTYHALKKMREEGLVEILRVEQEGRRSREVYTITAQGRDALRVLLMGAWSSWRPGLPMNWFVALSFLGELDRTAVQAQLEAQLAVLEQEMAEGETHMSEVLGETQPPHLELMFENARAHIQADLHFLRRLIERLPHLEHHRLELPSLDQLLAKHPRLRERVDREHVDRERMDRPERTDIQEDRTP